MSSGSRRGIIVIWLAMVASMGASTAQAQIFGPPKSQDRSQRWEFYGGPRLTFSETVDFGGGGSLETEDDVGLGFGFAYNFDEHLQLGGDFSWSSLDYDATLVDPNDPMETASLSGDLDTSTMSVLATWHFLKGPVTPYVSANLGWTWVDTNIISGISNGCWWDPWWGYICGPYYDTYDDNEVSYGLGAGVRWDIGPSLFARLGYEQVWVDFSNASGSPDFGSLRLEFGGKY